jgi:hypothetical protein
MPGAGAVHHIKLGPRAASELGPLFSRERTCGSCAHNLSLGKTPSNRLKSNGIWSTEIRTTLAATGLTIRFSLGLAAILASGLRITPAFLESRRRSQPGGGFFISRWRPCGAALTPYQPLCPRQASWRAPAPSPARLRRCGPERWLCALSGSRRPGSARPARAAHRDCRRA